MATLAYDPVRVFERERARLWALAYRMLASADDAEDVVQETFVRWHGAPHAQITTPEAWLTTACTRLAIDSLRRAHRHREEYVGPWLPEPVVDDGAEAGPLEAAELSESLSTAFLLVLERLTPVERAAFLLHDVFDYEYADVARILGKSEPAVRQMLSRARKRVRGEQPRAEVPRERQAELLHSFLAAVHAGELAPLQAMLTDDVQLWSDGGGRVTAARNVVKGSANVARFFTGIARKAATLRIAFATINGRAGLVLYVAGALYGTLSFDTDAEGRVSRVFLVLNPDKLRHVPVVDPETLTPFLRPAAS